MEITFSYLKTFQRLFYTPSQRLATWATLLDLRLKKKKKKEIENHFHRISMDKFHLFCNKNIATSLFSRCKAIFHGVCPLLFKTFVFKCDRSKYCRKRDRLWIAIKCSTVLPSSFGDVRCASSLRAKSAKKRRLSAITQTWSGVFPWLSNMSAVFRVPLVDAGEVIAFSLLIFALSTVCK